MPLLGKQHAPRIRWEHCQHPEPLTLIAQGQVQTGRRRQGIGAQAGRLRMIRDPLRNRQVCTAKRLVQWSFRGVVQFAVRLRQEDHGATLEHLGDVTHRNARHVANASRYSELAAHGVQQRSAPFASAGYSRLLPDRGNQIGNDQCDQQHDGERHEILGIGDCERKLRRNEEEVEGRDIQHCGQYRGSPSQPQRCHGHTQQIDHHQVRELETPV